ncbi:GDP-L-galactose phosphorylase 1-like isoform X2 [Typha angustifolia]|uniref:GDP-L-galactose phosphorylase 1-like isoform X2 n=1 Tax=Typha angustifolia TaxID=59011 RepID=UPI003C2B49AF
MFSKDQQKEHAVDCEESGRGGAGDGSNRNYLSKCCILQGARLPLYCFSKIDSREPRALFLDRLLKEWEERRMRGLFHHDINACETKILPGEHNFIATLVEGRDLKKRPTEFRMDEVIQPFDDRKFNFTKVKQDELIFRFEENENGEAKYFENNPMDVSASPNIVAINLSPIGYGHVLLIPRLLDCLPQRIDRESFLLAVYMTREAGNPYFRMGYNSLGGFATINHLHFQGYFLEVSFPIEKAPTQRIATLGSGISIFELMQYPIRGLVFEGGIALQDLSDTVSSVCILLQENDKPYNVLISESGKRIFLLLQCYAKKQALGEVSQELLETRLNPAAWELSGHLVFKRREDYAKASEQSIYKFLVEAALSKEQFEGVKQQILDFLFIGAAKDKIGE